MSAVAFLCRRQSWAVQLRQSPLLGGLTPAHYTRRCGYLFHWGQTQLRRLSLHQIPAKKDWGDPKPNVRAEEPHRCHSLNFGIQDRLCTKEYRTAAGRIALWL